MFLCYPWQQCLLAHAVRSVLVCEASGTRALNLWMSLLFRCNVWIPSEMALRIHAAGRHFLHAYARLARLCFDQRLAHFGLAPKLHMFWHLNFDLRFEGERYEWVGNPMIHNCSSDEDFIGKFCFLTRCVSPRNRIQRSMERYFTQVLLNWMHPNRKS